MQNLQEKLTQLLNGEITREEFEEAMKSSLESFHEDLYLGVNTNKTVHCRYTKRDYEQNTRTTVSDADWSELCEDYHFEDIFGDTSDHMEAMCQELEISYNH